MVERGEKHFFRRRRRRRWQKKELTKTKTDCQCHEPTNQPTNQSNQSAWVVPSKPLQCELARKPSFLFVPTSHNKKTKRLVVQLRVAVVLLLGGSCGSGKVAPLFQSSQSLICFLTSSRSTVTSDVPSPEDGQNRMRTVNHRKAATWIHKAAFNYAYHGLLLYYRTYVLLIATYF